MLKKAVMRDNEIYKLKGTHNPTNVPRVFALYNQAQMTITLGYSIDFFYLLYK